MNKYEIFYVMYIFMLYISVNFLNNFLKFYLQNQILKNSKVKNENSLIN